MTVCAWDGRILATDGASFISNQITQMDAVKLHHFSHSDMGPCVAACSGTMAFMRPWMDYMEERGFSAYANEDVCHAIVVSRTGRAAAAFPTGGYFKIDEFEAIGAGALLATAALRDGADAIEAVKYASRHHAHCGGTIRAYDWQSNVIVRIKE